MAASRFDEVLAAAMEDLVEHGYDDQHRVAMWMELLREAAEASFAPSARVSAMMADALRAIYRRLVERGEVVRWHPGVSVYTLQNVAPQLRAALDRRIAAAAELIRLNRQEMIEKTLRRFAGWATSIPVGGTEAAVRREAKKEIRKSFTSLPFNERRVLIDQGHKLAASISETVAAGNGAIALTWRSHWRQPGYNYREDHKERDGKIYALRDAWAFRDGLAKVGPDGWYDEITAVAQEPFCRCYAVYLYSLRDLERTAPEMLTAKGRGELTLARVA